jgi:hypothetical protein
LMHQKNTRWEETGKEGACQLASLQPATWPWHAGAALVPR